MSNPSPQLSIKSLYNTTLDGLCRSMNEELLVHVLNTYPPLQVLQILWKILRVADENQGFNKHTLSKKSSADRGRNIAQMSFENINQINPLPYCHFEPEALEMFAKTQQTKFIDKCNFCNHFDLKLFFKVVEITELRHQLFTIFQICVQVKGFEFPKQLAEKWIKSEQKDIIDENIRFHYIEQGLKLGIFLGDSGWLNESALVLSHTFNIIYTKWVCHDQNLKLIKIVQCLTKWLLVVSNYHKFDESKIVLHHMLNTIKILENMEGRTLCIAYAYVSVSQYYHILMEYNEAWSWAVKAVNELHDKSADVLKLLVISHAIKVCSNLNKLSTAKKLIDQLHTYDKEIDQNIHVDMLLNEACYSLKADLATDSIFNFHVALDSRRNLYGYYNLQTAIVFVDYAYARYVCDYASTNFSEALRSILQGIFVMNKIGVPDDNMLVVNAGRIKALILEEKALDIIHENFGAHYDNMVNDQGNPYSNELRRLYRKMKLDMLYQAEVLHLKALEVSLKAVGEKALLTAKSYCNLGRLYQSQEKYEECEEMHLKAIEIKESILGKDNPEVALSLGHLASLYTFQLKKFHEAEQLYLRSKAIYETTYGRQYTGLLYDFQGLTEVYRNLNDYDKYNRYLTYVHRFRETREAWLHQVHTAVNENCTKDDLSLEKFKCILNDCVCEK